jgi:hypothetical protein
MKYLKKFDKFFEDGASASAGVAGVTGGGGMGAVSTPIASATPGDVGGGISGSGDIGSNWGKSNIFSKMVAKPKRKKKRKKRAIKRKKK